MKTSEIIELIQVLENTDYRYIAINKEGTSILLSKDKVNEGSEKQISTLKEDKVEKVEETKVAVKESIEEINEQPQASTKDENCFIVKSPIVGTFYSSSSPEAEPFVKRGNIVKKGDVICIIEAMKLMNEIESEVDGEIVDILIENEAVVQYGQPLFKIKANS